MNSSQTLDNVGKNRWIASQNPDQEVKECTGCVMSCDHDDYGIIYNFLIGYYCWVALALDTEQTSHEILFRKAEFCFNAALLSCTRSVINALIFALALRPRLKRVKGRFIGIETIPSIIS